MTDDLNIWIQRDDGSWQRIPAKSVQFSTDRPMTDAQRASFEADLRDGKWGPREIARAQQHEQGVNTLKGAAVAVGLFAAAFVLLFVYYFVTG